MDCEDEGMRPECGNDPQFKGVVEFPRGCGKTKGMWTNERVVEFGNVLGANEWSEAEGCGICMEQHRNARGMCREGSRNMDSDGTHVCM